MSSSSLTAAELDANRGNAILTISIFFIVLSTLVFALRFVAHRVADSALFLDDWLMIPSYILMIALCADLILCKSLNTRYTASHFSSASSHNMIPFQVSSWVTQDDTRNGFYCTNPLRSSSSPKRFLRSKFFTVWRLLS